MPILLSCRKLAKSFDAQPLFDDVSFGVDQGDRLGLIGPNGSGKSTLMRIFAGVDEPDEGELAVTQGTRLVYLAQNDEFPADATPESVLVAATERSHPQWEDYQRATHARVILDQTGFGEDRAPTADQPVATLSGGWRKRLSIARALAQEADLLLMDEPTNHLDIEGIWWLERLLADASFTYVVVSHDRFFLERVCGRVVELNRLYPNGHFASAGGYSSFLEKRAEFIANQQSRQQALDNKVRREIEWLRSNPAAQMRKSTARIGQAEGMIADLAALKYRNSQGRRVDIDFTASGRRTNDLVVLDGVGKGLGGRSLFSEVELTLSPGTRLGVLGLNGSGKTTFLNVLAKRIAPDAGTVKHASDLKVVVFDQKREQLNLQQPLRRALCPTGETVVYRGRGIHVAAWAKRFLFSPKQLDLEVAKLSGGEQARILIAKLMLREADLLVLDEPTNDLDIPSLEVLEESLLEFPGAVALVTHDRYLLDRVSTSLLALDGRGNAYRVTNCAQWESLAARIAEAGRPSASDPALAPRPASSGLSAKERGELKRLVEKIEAAEKALSALSLRASDASVTSDPAKLRAACEAMANAQTEIDRLYARWELLSSKG